MLDRPHPHTLEAADNTPAAEDKPSGAADKPSAVVDTLSVAVDSSRSLHDTEEAAHTVAADRSRSLDGTEEAAHTRTANPKDKKSNGAMMDSNSHPNSPLWKAYPPSIKPKKLCNNSN